MTIPAADATGIRLGNRYWLETAIGRGGMATVYRARDESLGRMVAVKLFDRTAPDASRQESELGTLASLNHHGLVNILDAGFEADSTGFLHRYLVMELVTGMDLQRGIQTTQLSARNIAEIGYDLAEALEYVHARDIVHRDIKPSNVMLVDYGDGNPRARAKLTDFGIALSSDSERITVEGTTTGTAAYLSPEQARGAEVGPPSDVYSLGLVLLECFTRAVEFPGKIVESAMARLSRDPRMPRTISEDWQMLLAAMTAQEPSERPTAQELTSALRSLVIAEVARHRDITAELNTDEGQRLEAVQRYDVLDSAPDGAFDSITALAARMFEVPVAIISIVDAERVWFKSTYGLSISQVDRVDSLCVAAIMSDAPWVVSDARLDPSVLDTPLVIGELGFRFYAGVPLRTPDGFNLGTLCILDFEPREISDEQIRSLKDLADVVMTQLELRLDNLRMSGEIRRTMPSTTSDETVSFPRHTTDDPVAS